LATTRRESAGSASKSTAVTSSTLRPLNGEGGGTLRYSRVAGRPARKPSTGSRAQATLVLPAVSEHLRRATNRARNMFRTLLHRAFIGSEILCLNVRF
jgi:hypothetical protein